MMFAILPSKLFNLKPRFVVEDGSYTVIWLWFYFICVPILTEYKKMIQNCVLLKTGDYIQIINNKDETQAVKVLIENNIIKFK